MKTPITDGINVPHETASGTTHYWCGFTDQMQTRVVSLCSQNMPHSDGAILLSETDPRVQHFLNPPEGRCVQRLTLTSLEDLNRLAYQFENGVPKPIYRGQSDYCWGLQAKIERNIPPFVMEETGLEVYEHRIVTESQRRLHHFLTELPDEDDLLSWLALLRHHGVPTRLLDMTRSLFVACYFALRDAKPGSDAAVWIFSRQAIDNAFTDWGRHADDSWLRTSPFTVAQYGEPYYWPFPKKRKAYDSAPTIASLRLPNTPFLDLATTLDAAMRGFVEQPGIAVAEPFWLSRRMDVQQGVFLIPFNVRLGFEKNIFSFLSLSSAESEERTVPNEGDDLLRLWADFKVIKLRIPANLHGILRARLDAMNIRDLTLFPDVEGTLAHLATFVPVEGK